MSQLYFKVDVYSHNFCLTRISARGLELIGEFSKPYKQWGVVRENRRFIRKVLKVFGTKLEDKTQFRFHIEQFPAFINFLNELQVHESCYEVQTHIPDPGITVEMSVREGWVLRDYQIPINEYLISDLPLKRKLLEIQTGKGKTFSAMNAIGSLSKRLVIFIKPAYMEKWASDVVKICEIDPEDVLSISGSAALMQLIHLAETDQLDCKVIIVSNKTMQNWISLYERVGDDSIELLGYGCKPQDFLQVVKAGMRLIDEVHQDFHLNFKIDLYTHVERSISLSATLVADDPFLTKMYLLAYPKAMRYAGLEYHKYIKSFSWIYRFNRPDIIKTTEYGSTTYSHIAFEKSVLKRPKEIVNYVEMLDSCIRDTFTRHQQPGDKLLIYCSSINMCTYVSNFLKKLYPERDIRRYVEDDPYDNLMSAEICVSTLLSAGTGHDIPGLTTVILTSAVSSTQSNIQGFGRLREIPGRDVRFIYFVCSDIPKHIDYHEKKKNILKETALSYDSISYNLLL